MGVERDRRGVELFTTNEEECRVMVGKESLDYYIQVHPPLSDNERARSCECYSRSAV